MQGSAQDGLDTVDVVPGHSSACSSGEVPGVQSRRGWSGLDKEHTAAVLHIAAAAGGHVLEEKHLRRLSCEHQTLAGQVVWKQQQTFCGLAADWKLSCWKFSSSFFNRKLGSFLMNN